MRPPPVTRHPPGTVVLVLVVVLLLAVVVVAVVVLLLLVVVSVHGVLSGFAVLTHEPVSWLHAESTQSLLGQDGQSGMELDCWPDDERLLSQLASSADAR